MEHKFHLPKSKPLLALVEKLRFPLVWDRDIIGEAAQIFLKRWYYSLSEETINREVDLMVLRGPYGVLEEPTDESMEASGLMDGKGNVKDDDVACLVTNCERITDEFRKQFVHDYQKYVNLRALDKDEWRKHYALGASNMAEIMKLSKGKPNVGFLLPNLTTTEQLKLFWRGLSIVFDERMDVLEETGLSEKKAFEGAWEMLLTNDAPRLCVDTLANIGVFGGKMARWLIYKTEFDSSITHCYVAPAAPEGANVVAVDDLQGLEQAFSDRRTD